MQFITSVFHLLKDDRHFAFSMCSNSGILIYLVLNILWLMKRYCITERAREMAINNMIF